MDRTVLLGKQLGLAVSMALILIIALMLGVTGGRLAHAAPATRVSTNMPQSWGYTQANAHIAETVADLNGMPRGATFRVADYLFRSHSATDAMIAAYRRGVNIRVVLDSQVNTVEWRKLDAVIGHDRSKGSFVYKVTGSGLKHVGRMHAKLIQVSSTSAGGGRTRVTRIGSQNLSPTNTLSSANENSEWTDPKIYSKIKAYFNAIVADKGTGYRFKTVTSGSVRLHLYPGGPDVVSAALGKVKAGSDTAVFVSVYEWSDSSWQVKKAVQLDNLARSGCKVQIAWNYLPTEVLIGPRSGAVLLSSGKVGVHNVRRADLIYTHLKLTGMRYKVNGKYVHRTFSGSQNYLDNRSTGANIVVENTSGSVWKAYAAGFKRLYDSGMPAQQPVYGPQAMVVHDEEKDLDNGAP